MKTRWATASLNQLGTWAGGGTPSKANPSYWGGELPWVSPKDMKTPVLTSTIDRITEEASLESAAKALAANSIAVVVRSGILDHTLPVALVPFRAAYNQDMKVLTPYECVHVTWLLWALRSAAPRILLDARKDGTTVSSIDFAKLATTEILVPPPADQETIAALLDKEMAALDASVVELATVRKHAALLRRAALRELQYAEWPRERVDAVGDVFVGATPRRNQPQLWNGDIPWVSSSEVAFRRIASTKETISEAGLGNRGRRLHPPKTVLLAMYGDGKTRGQAGILDIEAATNQAVAAVRCNPDKVRPEFLYYCFMAQYEQVRSVGRGGQQTNLNKGLVEAVEIPRPELDEQDAVIARLQALLGAADEHERASDDLDRLATTMCQTLMRDALSGDLTVPSTDGPTAAEFLACLRGPAPDVRQPRGRTKLALT